MSTTGIGWEAYRHPAAPHQELVWRDLNLSPVDPAGATIYLRAAGTKTKTARAIPITSRLRAVLEMRRCGPDGKELPLTAYGGQI